VEFVEKDAVVVLTASVTATSGVAAVLADATVTGRHISTLFAVVRETGRLRREKASHRKQGHEVQDSGCCRFEGSRGRH